MNYAYRPAPVTLPDNLTDIRSEAFAGTVISDIQLPDGCKSIGARAFAYSGLELIRIPDIVVSIASDAFDGCRALTICCAADSYAAGYAAEHGIRTAEWQP